MKKQNQVFLIVAVLTLCIIDALPNSMTPVIADFAKLYPNVDPALLAQVVSVPSLVYAVSSLFSGIFLNKFGYKKTIVGAIVLILIGGLAPVIVTNFNLVLVFRAIFGLGIGIGMAGFKALISLTFKGDTQARVFGYQNACGTLIISALQIVSGYIAVINVAASYMVHAFVIISLLALIFFIPEPEGKLEEPEKLSAEEKAAAKKGIPAAAYILIAVMILRSVPMITIMLNTSSLVYELGIGDSATSGKIQAVLAFGSLPAGFLFVYTNKLFKKYTLTAGLIIEMLGGVLMSFGNSVGAFMAAYIICGFGMITFCSAIAVKLNEITPAKSIGTVMGMLVGLPYLSSFISPYYTLLISRIMPNYTTQSVFMVGVVLDLILIAVTAAVTLRKNNSEKAA